MQREYKTAINNIRTITFDVDGQKGFDIEETDQFLNIMGKDNWELMQVSPVETNGYTQQFVYFFKRPLKIEKNNLPDIGYDIDHNGITGSQR